MMLESLKTDCDLKGLQRAALREHSRQRKNSGEWSSSVELETLAAKGGERWQGPPAPQVGAQQTGVSPAMTWVDEWCVLSSTRSAPAFALSGFSTNPNVLSTHDKSPLGAVKQTGPCAVAAWQNGPSMLYQKLV